MMPAKEQNFLQKYLNLNIWFLLQKHIAAFIETQGNIIVQGYSWKCTHEWQKKHILCHCMEPYYPLCSY